MTSLPRTLSTEAAWIGPDMAARRNWIHELTRAEIDELDSAVARARASGKPLAQLSRADFPLDGLARSAERWLDVLDGGRGFVLVRGVPVERYGEEDASLAYWGLGLHLGIAVSQNAAGDLLGHVRDAGVERRDPTLRLYRTRERLGFHTDGSDIVGLLCLRPAKSGGTSRIASSAAIYNEILRRRPDLASTLHEPFPFDRNGEERPGEPPFFSLPICRETDGRLRTFYIGWYIRDSQRHPQAPRLTRAQHEVIDLIDQIAADPRIHLDMDFRAGDIQWLENAAILHARTEFEDHAEPERKRHLLRLWLTSRRSFTDGDALLQRGIAAKQGSVSDAAAARGDRIGDDAVNHLQRVTAEGLGTALLLAAIVGSGIMGERLANGNIAIALLANSIATGAALAALILSFGAISGAHFNPVVTLCMAGRGSLPWREAPAYVAAQVVGAVLGVAAAHLMFGEPVLSLSTHARSGPAQAFSECVATFGLLAVIGGCSRGRAEAVPFAVAAYITAAYWFTASTSFANPAVTLARALTRTFAGIRAVDVPPFIAAQLVGAAVAALLFGWLVPAPASSERR
jgi:glycerol uptake facilitator-like aquaporin